MSALLILGFLLVLVLVLVGREEEKNAQRLKREKEEEPIEAEAKDEATGFLPEPLEEPYTPEAPVETVVRRRPGRPRKEIVTEVSPGAVPGRRSRKVH